MLVFDYTCKKCKITEEKFVKSGEDVIKCDLCGRTMVKDAVLVGGVKVKGGTPKYHRRK